MWGSMLWVLEERRGLVIWFCLSSRRIARSGRSEVRPPDRSDREIRHRRHGFAGQSRKQRPCTQISAQKADFFHFFVFHKRQNAYICSFSLSIEVVVLSSLVCPWCRPFPCRPCTSMYQQQKQYLMWPARFSPAAIKSQNSPNQLLAEMTLDPNFTPSQNNQ